MKPFVRFAGHAIWHLLTGLGAHRIAAGVTCMINLFHSNPRI